MNSKKLISLFSTLVLGTSIFPVQLVNADELNHDVQIDNDFKELSNVNDSVIDRFNKFSVLEESLNTKKDVDSNTNVMKKENISSNEEVTSSPEKSEESNEQIASSPAKTEESNEQTTTSPAKTEESDEQTTTSPAKTEESDEQTTTSPAKTEESDEQTTTSSVKTEESNEQMNSSSEGNAKSNTPAESDYIELDYNYLKSNFEFIEEPGFGVFRLVGTKKKDITKIIIPTTVYYPKYRTNWEVQYDQGFINSIKKDSSYKNYLQEFKIAIRNSTSLNPWDKREMDLSDLFRGFGSLTKVDLEGLNWGKIKSTARMFENCYSIKEIDLSNWIGLDSNRSVDMTRMFSNTASLRKIDLRNMPLDYQKTTEILGTRSSNTSAINTPLTVIVNSSTSSYFLNFDFVKESGRIPASFPVLDANGGRFSSGNSTIKYLDKICATPKDLEISTFNKWKEEKIPNKEGATFKQWIPSKEVGSPSSIFDLLDVVYRAQYTESIDWTYEENDEDVLLTSYIGTNTDIVVPNEVNGKPTKIDLTQAFPVNRLGGDKPWTKVTSVRFESKNNKKVKAIGNGLWFKEWSKMKSFDGSGLDVSSVRDMNQAFSGCNSLIDINLSGWNTSNVENMSKMFKYCWSLSKLDISSFDTGKVRDMNEMFYNCSGMNTIDVNHFNTESVTNMQQMFADCFDLKYLDLNNFKFSKNTIIDNMFKINNGKQLPLLVYSENLRLQDTNYDYKSDNRIPVPCPKLDANGGKLNKQSEVSYITTVCIVSSTLDLSIFNSWKEKQIPIKENCRFVRWKPSKDIESATSILDLLDVTYVAEWEKIIENNIPSPDDNVKPDVMSEFGIAYYPKEFSIKNAPLNDSGSQTIPFEKKGTFNVGIRDVSNLKDKWTLDAQLIWTGNKKIEGGEILTTNSEGIVNKNINNGENPFDPVKDLIPCDSTEIGAKANVVINSNAPTRLMTAKAVTHNGVYDYNLGDKVSLRIPETKNIEAGSYSGYVQWTLSNAIS